MKRLTTTVIGAFALLVFVVAPADALKVEIAKISAGEVQVVGNLAAKNADIRWEGIVVTRSNNGGNFMFSTTNLPVDCVSQLSDGVSTIDVVITGCATQQVISGGGVFATGQTTSYFDGDDGFLQKGLSTSPDPRFTDNLDGTIKDNLSGLIWLKNANCFGVQEWAPAITEVNGLANSACGLTDGSAAGDWRLPNRNELTSLLDLGTNFPTLPADHPFTNFQPAAHWSSTTYANNLGHAWYVIFANGELVFDSKIGRFFVIAVRGGS